MSAPMLCDVHKSTALTWSQRGYFCFECLLDNVAQLSADVGLPSPFGARDRSEAS